jgi:FAD/FMN-containing dehydrogenase
MASTTTGHLASALEALAPTFGGDLIAPGDPRYDEARAVYNAMIDRRPALVARCRDAGDVVAAVRLADAHGLPVAVRGGGHNGPGFGTVDDGVVVDLSPMRGVRVDPGRRLATAAGGALLRDLDHATGAFGLATPAGIVSTTGVGGLTLGGGHGYLSRQLGLTVDNLAEADVVLADGRLVTASEREHPDLFWALRGGGGNFGVATALTFRLHPVSVVWGGPTLWAIDDAAEVLRWYRAFQPAAPDDVCGFFAFLDVPPAPPFPEALHGKRMCGVVWCCTGDRDAAERTLATAVREPAEPALHGAHEVPYAMLQQAFDALYPAGCQWYWRGDFVRELPDAAIEQHVAHGGALPTPQSLMHLYPVDGAVQRVAPADTAWAHRDATWSMVIAGVDPDPARAGELRDWTVGYHEAVRPYDADGAYVNFMMDEGADRVRATYGANYDRLRRVKADYDPGNRFRVNQNIPPAG